ncbi:MAG: zinc-binding dehydrogenase [Nitrospirae bacterium]|nr:zinc-binding dehydrogenase [Nitrospirota bacterium]
MVDLPKKAKAAVWVKAGAPVEIREYPVVPPPPGHVLVKIERANICGSDLHMYRGDAFAGMPLPFAFVMGHEMMGSVAALGEGVERDARGNTLSPGDLVTFSYFRGCGTCGVCLSGREYACFFSLISIVSDADEAPHFKGGWAEYYYVRPGQKVFKVPEGVSPQLAAGCNCALAQVIHGLRTVGLRYGDQVVIQGAGGLGLYATAVARKMGASKIVVIDGIQARLDLAKEFGADEVVSMQAVPDAKERTSFVKGLTNGGSDVCIEVVGRAVAVNEGVRMLQRGGRYLIMGSINPRDFVKLDPSICVTQNLTLYGVCLYDPICLGYALDFVREAGHKLPMDKMSARTFALTEVNQAIEAADALSNQKTTALRVQLTMEGR